MRQTPTRTTRHLCALAARAALWAVLGGVPPLVAAQEPTRMEEVRLVIHYQSRGDRGLADAMAEVLGALDYRVAGMHLVGGSGDGEIKYFRAADRTAALHVQSIVENVLVSRGRREPLTVAERAPVRHAVAAGHIEIWVPSSPRSKRRPARQRRP